MKGRSLIPLALLTLACSASHADPVARRAAPIAEGVADTEHDSVFIMVSHQDQSGSVCTATLIAPNLLLTARHCISSGERQDIVCGVSTLGEPYPGSAIYATNDPVPEDGSPYVQGLDIFVPDEGADTCGFDMALVQLAENVPQSMAVPAIVRIDRGVEAGETYTAVGYGADETGEPTGRREMRGGLSVECQPGLCGFGVESTEFRGETGICSGDSGGPAFDQDGKVVGVVSRGGVSCGSPVYGAVAAWREWITDIAKQAAQDGGYTAPFWVLTGKSDPEPVDPPNDGGTAGAGSGPNPPEPSDPGGQGDPCAGPDECLTGHACYSGDGSPAGQCVALCTNTAACGEGLVCTPLGETSVCLEVSGSPDDSGGCSIAAGRAASQPLGFGLLGLLMGARLLRRMRRTHSC